MRSVSLSQPIESFVSYGGPAVLATLSSMRTVALPVLQASSVVAPPLVTTALAAGVVCAGAELFRAARHEPPQPRPVGAKPVSIDRGIHSGNVMPLLRNVAIVGVQMLLASAALHGLGIGMCLSAPVIARHWVIGAIDTAVLLGLFAAGTTLSHRLFEDNRWGRAATVLVGAWLFLTYQSAFAPLQTSFLS